MPRPAVSHKHLSSELARQLDDEEYDGFQDTLGAAREVGYNLDEHYGKEVGFKTILHLAIDEDDYDTTPYIDTLLKAGASAKHVNSQLFSAPIHVAAEEIKIEAIKLLLKYPDNKADVNAVNKLGLTAIHILLSKLLDFALLQNKQASQRPGKMSDEDIDKNILNAFEGIKIICMQKELRFDFDHSPPMPMSSDRMTYSHKKISTMTPLQILCSFQTWNAPPISLKLHKGLAEVVDIILNRGVDPNAVSAKNSVVGSVAGSTPPVFLAATRGYHMVVEVFKRFFDTNFLIENKFQQTILHMVLKAGYNNKILVHGDECGRVNEQTVYALLSDNNNFVKHAMKSLINRVDSSGNTALHYAKHYPNQEVVKFMLRNGAKIHKNPQGSVNVNPKILEDYFFEDCMEASSDDVDDEEFFIKINFGMFARPEVDSTMDISQVRTSAQAWSINVEKDTGKNVEKKKKKAKVDTKRLEYFGDVDQFRFLLKHPVLSSFLEMELNYLKNGYILEFLLYLTFVLVIFKYFGERFTSIKQTLGTTYVIYTFTEWNYSITITSIVCASITLILILRELYQLCKLKKRYFHYFENVIEWCVLLLVIFSLLPNYFMKFESSKQVQKHLAAFTFLLAFMQLYLLLVRIVPNTPIPLYINMFTTVLRTYTFILLSYFAFLLSFAFAFSLVFAKEDDNMKTIIDSNSNTTDTAEEADDGEIDHFGTIWHSLMKTIIMFAGEMDYTDIPIQHPLGYVLFLLFVFLMVIVLMNLLNGLAVSDIHKIQKEVDTYYHVNIVETLAYSRYVPMLAHEIKISPNIKPENQKLLGIDIPGAKKYLVETDSKHKFYLHENTVKAAKDLIIDRQASSHDRNEKITLEGVGEDLIDVKKEQAGIKSRVARIEESIELILEIMQSRRPTVDRV